MMNIHRLPIEGNFCDKHGKAQKPVTVTYHNQHTGYTDNGDKMPNSYSSSWRKMKWTKITFQPLGLNCTE